MNKLFKSSLPNGVTSELIRINGHDPIHSMMLDEKLLVVVENEALAHSTTVDTNHFGAVLDAVRVGKIQAYFMIIGWENCRPKFGGGAIEFPTVLTEWNGNAFDHYPATLNEDTYVPSDISNVVRDRTKSLGNEKGIGLGSHLMYERIKLAVDPEAGTGPYGMVSRGRIAEFSAHSRMGGLLTKLNGQLGTTETPILELKELTASFFRGYDVPIETRSLAPPTGGEELSNVFATHWASEDGREQIAATFTDAISTFTGGLPIVRVQLTTNAQTPDDDTLKDALSALTLAAYAEIAKRNWPSVHRESKYAQHPRITMRIHTHDKRVAQALRDMGATPRFLGPNLMLPALTNYAHVPQGVLHFNVPTATPLRVSHVSTSKIGSRPSDQQLRETLVSKPTEQSPFPT